VAFLLSCGLASVQRSLSEYSWAHPPTSIGPRFGHSGVVIEDEVYFYGGANGNGVLNDLYKYSVANNVWTRVRPENGSPSFAFHSGVMHGKDMVLFGSERAVYSYHSLNNTWRRVEIDLDSYGIPSVGHSAVVVGDSMFIFGGRNTEDFVPHLFKWDFSSNTLVDISNGLRSSFARGFHSAVWDGTKMIVYGGVSYDWVPLNEMWFYFPNNNTWKRVQPVGTLPEPRAFHTAVLTGGHMLILGGIKDRVNTTGNMLKYDIKNNSWITVRPDETFPSAVRSSCASYVSSVNKVVYFGGATDLVPGLWFADHPSNQLSVLNLEI